MNPCRIVITDRDGWRKEFELNKNLIYIGSDPGDDLSLSASRGAGVAPRHLQLVSVQGDRQRYYAINLGDADLILSATETGDRVLSPRSAADLVNGHRLQLGEFTLIFAMGPEGSFSTSIPAGVQGPIPENRAGPAERRAGGPAIVAAAEQNPSAVIGLSLSLPQTTLDAQYPLVGTIILHNLGNKPGVQFKLELEGLEPDCYDIGPAPILFPNAQKEVPLRLQHPRRPTPVAGGQRISIRATAPDAYPGEIASVSQVIQIVPFFKHSIRLVSES
jgi:hypothetical protein